MISGSSIRSTMGTLRRRRKRKYAALPRRGLVILQELTPHVLSGEPSREDGIENPRGAIDDVERWRETKLGFAGGMDGRILVRHPSGVDRIHVNAVLPEIRGARARHHIERGLRHVGMRMLVRLGGAVELTLHRTDVDDVLMASGRAQ